MSHSIEDVVKKFQDLTKEWNKKNKDIRLCEDAVKSLKLDLTKFHYLPTTDANVSKRELLIASEFRTLLPESPYKYELLGLNLLRLLADGDLPAFHTELEWLTKEEIEGNVYINHPVSMEQYLMEGNFHKLFLSKGNVPSERYTFFIDILLNTVRSEIASCIEAAYTDLPLNEVRNLMVFDIDDQIIAYGKQKKWDLDNNNIYHFAKATAGGDECVPSKDIASIMLDYTKELDKIV